MGAKALPAAPLWAALCQKEPSCFHILLIVTENSQILLCKGFDAHAPDGFQDQLYFSD